MKILTYYNAKEKAERDIEILESYLGDVNKETIWRGLMRRLRQNQKFTERLVALIQKADNK